MQTNVSEEKGSATLVCKYIFSFKLLCKYNVFNIYILFVFQHRNITEYGDMWGQTVYLRRVRVSDTGWYTCIVSNLFGSKHASAWVQVISKSEARIRAQKSSAATLAIDFRTSQGLHRTILLLFCVFLSWASWQRMLNCSGSCIDHSNICQTNTHTNSTNKQLHKTRNYIMSLYHKSPSSLHHRCHIGGHDVISLYVNISECSFKGIVYTMSIEQVGCQTLILCDTKYNNIFDNYARLLLFAGRPTIHPHKIPSNSDRHHRCTLILPSQGDSMPL